MKTKNKVFFGEAGITATSANYLCNLAKEVVAEDEEELNSASFIEKTVEIIGSSTGPKTASEGKEEDWVGTVPERIHRIMDMHSLIAWLREAIKAKEDEAGYWKNYTYETWLEEVKKTELVNPYNMSKPTPTDDDVIGDMNISERYRYLAAEACASSIGKFIHPNGAINKARKEMLRHLANPVETSGEGSNLVITNYKGSVHVETVDTLFGQLQNEQRSYEKVVNSFKSQISEERSKRAIEASNTNSKLIKEYTAQNGILYSEYEAFQRERLDEVSKLKIVIPNALKDTVAYLNSLGQPEESK